jgi:hypothetical protein
MTLNQKAQQDVREIRQEEHTHVKFLKVLVRSSPLPQTFVVHEGLLLTISILMAMR